MAEPVAGPRVIVFSGPKEGVGKSTVALNLAMAWAGVQRRQVILVHLDPMGRSDQAGVLGVNPPSVADLIRNVGSQAGTARLIRGRIPISQYGVGFLPLVHKRADFSRIAPDAVMDILGTLSETYDLFLDVDPYFPLQLFSFDVADVVFWTLTPQRAQLQATIKFFEDLKSLHFALDRFDLVVNRSNLPGALASKEMDRFAQSMGKKITAFLPWEDKLPEMSNLQKVLIVENPNSAWVRALKALLAKVWETPPSPKSWSVVPAAEGGFSRLADILWKTETDGDKKASAQEARVKPEEAAGPRPAFWDELKEMVHKQVVGAMETARIHVGDNAAQNQELRQKVEELAMNFLQKEEGAQLSREQRSQFLVELLDEILGLGPLEQLMRDPNISEIMVNAPDKVYIERGGKLVLSGIRFRSEEQIVQVIKRIVAPIGRRIDESVPLVDARLKDGSRVNAIIAPLAVSGPTLTIRRFSAKPLVAEDLAAKGSITADVIRFLDACVKLRKDIIISGGTGTGKTTFLNMLSNYIPEDERIVTVEDTAELKLIQEHWVRLESRPPNIEGKGEVTIRDLVRNCLRMRPDRIVVGECRGAEALDMLQAMNTGHEGSLATIHANSPRDALTRLEAMCMMANAELPIWALREMICSAVHLIVQLTRFSDGSRKVTYITEVTGRQENMITAQDLFVFKQTGVSPEGKVLGEFVATGNLPGFYHDFKTKGIHLPVEIFQPKKK